MGIAHADEPKGMDMDWTMIGLVIAAVVASQIVYFNLDS